MTNEAVLIFRKSNPINFIVADGTGIEKGTACKGTSPMTASAVSGTNDLIAGIAAKEKVANDGVTSLGMYRDGIFRVYVSGSASYGDAMGVVVTNSIIWFTKITAAASGSRVWGYMLEDATTGQAKLMELNIGSKPAD